MCTYITLLCPRKRYHFNSLGLQSKTALMYLSLLSIPSSNLGLKTATEATFYNNDPTILFNIIQCSTEHFSLPQILRLQDYWFINRFVSEFISVSRFYLLSLTHLPMQAKYNEKTLDYAHFRKKTN